MDSTINPFVYDSPVNPKDLIDRKSELELLLGLARGGHSTRLSAPRRYGKTTLLKRLLANIQEQPSLAAVYVDFYGVMSIGEIASRIEKSYRFALHGPLRRMVNSFIRASQPTARIAPGGIGIELNSQVRIEQSERLSQLLDLPLKLHERSGKRVVIAFDEFQSVLGADNAIDAVMRSRIQHHREVASYIFAGSHPGLMSELFDHRERPFYSQARPVRLSPLADSDLIDYIGERFEQTGRDIGTALELLLDLAQGHPQRAMLLAHHLWAVTPKKATADSELWDMALANALSELSEALQATWDRFTKSEQKIMTALSVRSSSLYSADTLTTFNLTKGTIQNAVKSLRASGDLQDLNGQVIVVDPLLAYWVRQRYL